VLSEILTALAKVRVRLRAAVADEITRRRVPELSFNVNLAGGSEEE
jgi:ribosome-binding factor A